MPSFNPTIVFDLDGTLADTLPDLACALNFATATHGFEPVELLQIRNMVGSGLKEMIRQACTINGATMDELLLDELLKTAVAEYTRNTAVHSKLFPGVENSLEQFKKNGWILAVCTNKPVGLATKLLAELRQDNKFTSVCGVDSFPFKKPDARHLMQTIENAGGSITRAIMVGDASIDIETARNAGIPAIAVDFGYADMPVADFNADAIISHFDTLFETATRLVQVSQ